MQTPASIGPAGEARTAAQPRRFPELDALRGLAALAVVFNHFVVLWRGTASPAVQIALDAVPLRFMWSGHHAVLLFFLISGFVLTLPYMSAPPAYPAFLARRICRIWLPYLAALALAVAGAAAFHSPIPALGPWFNQTWSAMPTADAVVDHVAFVGRYPNVVFNTAFWSLVYEMRISIVFPPIAWAVLRFPPAVVLPAAFLASMLAAWPASSPSQGDWLPTIHFAALFVVGALLARNLDAVRAFHDRLGPRPRRIATCAALLLVAYDLAPPERSIGAPHDWLVVPGLAWLLMSAICHDGWRRALLSPLPAFLGRISYSLYLVHGTVLFALVHVAWGHVALPWLLPAYVGLSIGLAVLAHRLVEEPAKALGHAIAGRLARNDAGAGRPANRFAIREAGR
ncbi:MAG: acyltransferase [Rhizobiales bacterium]|nr:acyltransferase [Hyphomicrobiales bacterium]